MFTRVVTAKEAPSGKHATVRGARPSEESAAKQSPREAFAPATVFWDFRNIPTFPPANHDQTHPGEAGKPGGKRRLGIPPWPTQAKLEVGAIDDPLEREADRAAAEVMRMPMLEAASGPDDAWDSAPGRSAKAYIANPSASGHAASLQEKCACDGTCDNCKAEQGEDEHRKIRLKPQSAGSTAMSTAVPAIVHQVLSEPGHPLDAATRAFFEARFERDLSRVQVHSGPRAAASARAVNARAYTVGNHIVFRNDEFNRSETEGRTLVAHELAHVIQQSAADVSPRRPSAATTEAAAHPGSRRRPTVASGAPVALARQPSSSTAEDEVYQAFLDMPQVEKDRLMSTAPAVAPTLNTTGAVAPQPAAPSPDVGCHTDPYKSAPGQSKCNVSHHKAPDDATRATTALMNSPRAANVEKGHRSQLDRLNAAYLFYKRTGKYIYRDEFSPYEIEKDNVIATSDRWDNWMNSRGVGINNLGAAKFDEGYFRSQSEFELERSRRDQEYQNKLNDCKKEHGPKWPKASRTRPDDIVCAERVDAEYGPAAAAAKDASRMWAYRQLQQLDRIENAGPVSTAGMLVGGTARVLSGGSSVDAVPSALALGGLGDALALGPGAPPLQGTAQDPGQAPGERVEFMPSGQGTANPPGSSGGGNPSLGGALRMPVRQGQTIVDTETLIALDKNTQPGVPLSPRETTIVSEMQGRSIIATPTGVGQFNAAGMRGTVPMTQSVPHTPAERQDILRALENAGVGTAGGTADREIVADAFLAQSAPNTVPVFATSDGGVINGLFRRSGMNPANMGGYNVREFIRYTRGQDVFVVGIGERVLVVRPLQPLGPRH
jgi:Domain of unknown function (DUF4157)